MRHKAKLSYFDYNLPEELIAQYPTDFRDQSRMMVLHRTDGTIEHKNFVDILDEMEITGSKRFAIGEIKPFEKAVYEQKVK